MDVGAIAQLATGLSNQRTQSEVSVAVANLAKDNMKQQGQAAMQLIEAIPQPQGNVGNNLNVKV